MDRPYIICHMVTSLDGKVTGNFLGKDVHSGLIEDYYRIHREYGADGFLCVDPQTIDKANERRYPLRAMPLVLVRIGLGRFNKFP